jgi:glycosyltransferase involved in cell wall biosynthesis
MTFSDQPQTAVRQHPAASRVGGPSFAVVIASIGARSWLAASLSALIPQCLRRGTELIVARADTPAAMTQLSAAYPYVRFIAAPPRTDTSELRRLGLAASSGDVVALLDDTDERTLPDEQWLDGLRWRRADEAGSSEEPSSAPLPPAAQPGVSAAVDAIPFVPYPSAPMTNATSHPYLSVVVAVHQGGDALRHSLEALSWSDLPRTEWELIVVDDASTDETAWIAAEHADILVRLPGKPRGPAYAKNRGFEVSRGEYVAFIDADVCVHRDTLAQFVLVLSREPQVSAVFGAFDTNPAAKGLVSQYRNLLAHYYHRQHPGPAETFWASCGAIRKNAFLDAGMFDEWRFPRRQVEDFELGYQLRERGHRIALRPEIHATSLRRWTLGRTLAADLQDRSVPWMRIFGRRDATLGRRSARLRTAKTVNTVLTWLAVALALGGATTGRPWLFGTAGALVLLVVVNDRSQHRFFARERGTWFAAAAAALQLLSYLVNGVGITLGWLLRELLGEPGPHPTVEAFAEVGVKMWPPVPTKRPTAAAGMARTG